MNAGRMSMVGWVLFLVGTIALALLVPAKPGTAVVLALAAVTVFSFVYAMYLCLAVIRYGDRRLVKRGVAGSAVVRSAKMTNVAMSAGEYEGIGAPSVWKYGLDVTAPDRGSYSTTLYICAHLQEGQTVPVFISKLNPKRVTIDLKQLAHAAAAVPAMPVVAPYTLRPAAQPDMADELTKLADLHQRGELTDAEFQAAKSRLLQQGY